MDKESKPGAGGLSGNGLIAVLLLATGALFVREIPLETHRPPASDPGMEQHFSLQDVDARLWQDPFGAVARGRAELRKKSPAKAAEDDAQRSAEALAEAVRRREGVEILAVMLGGGPYSDSIESRRRTRYAVLAGLNVSGYAPMDNEHLGYFIPPPASSPLSRLQEVVPYEWFEPAADIRPREGDRPRPAVLVVWLQSESFADHPLQRMKDLTRPFESVRVNWRVLGPWGSDGLKAMVDETVERDFQVAPSGLKRISYYSHYATVPDRALLENKAGYDGKSTLSAFLADKGVTLVRTIGSDQQLVSSLVGELVRRGLVAQPLEPNEGAEIAGGYSAVCRPEGDSQVEAPSHVAVVAEWDTLYGRSLRRAFMAKKGEPGFCVDRFNYVRGLDGQVPSGSGGGGDGTAGSGDGGKVVSNDKDAARRKDGTFVERAEGQSQFDYLRRLAVQMHVQDRKVRKSSADGRGLRAIGVLGNDVHDKLLVLQALQPEFPNAIFFTTDLDARFLHPREQAWSRNLLVASNFGLSLERRLQGGSPPFRDSYQTSAFFSTRIALDDAQRAGFSIAHDDGGRRSVSQAEIRSSWFDRPRIFEIGRTTAFDFSDGEARVRPCKEQDWMSCEHIHPPGSPRYPEPRQAMLALILSGLLLALWAPALWLSRSGRHRLSGFAAGAVGPAGRLLRYGALVLALLLVQAALPWWLASQWQPFAEWLTHDGKPLVAFEGISLWPTEGIRLLALWLCLYLLLRGWTMLDRNVDEISRQFRLGPTRRELVAEQRAIDADLPWWERLLCMFSLEFVPRSAPQTVAGHGMPAAALDFWKRHIVQNRLSARLVRTTVFVVLMLGLSGLLVQALGEDLFVPQRGDLSLRVHRALLVPAVVAMYYLEFFVVDATTLCVGFVTGLRRQAANWPLSTLDAFQRQLGIPKEFLDSWIDLRFIALRTRCVTRLIYYPFVVLSLLLLSRSATFDDWFMPTSTLLLAGVGAAIAVGCALALRLAAEASRRSALDQIRDALMRAHAARADDASKAPPPGQPTVEQLKLLLGRVEELHEGAFAPFWQQPLLKAVLLPFATLGGSTLLDYMALANL